VRVSFFAAALICCCSTMLQAELVSYWPFDEFPDQFSTPDVVSGFDMELLVDDSNDVEHVDGKTGKAFEFFGTNGSGSIFFYTQQDETDKLPINLQPEWTISMWAKVEGTGQNDLRLFSESNTGGDNNPLFNIGTANNGSDGSLDIYIRNNQLSTGTVNHPHTTEHPFNGEWNHVGWTYADGMHNVFVNGSYDSSYPMESFGILDPANIDTTTIGGILRGNASHQVTGIIDDVAIWDEVLNGAQIAALATEEVTPLEALDFAGSLPPFPVGDAGSTAALTVPGARDNLVFGEPSGDPVPGLGQSWFNVGNPGSKAGVDAIVTGSEPAVPYFQSEGGTWWSGSMAVSDVQAYPPEVEGNNSGNQYTVKLAGEILIEESGPITFLDGVDDFTFLAIDLDRSGTAGDTDDEVLINDNAWTNALSTGNGGADLVEVDFEGIEAGGEWLAIEFNMAEGGGGDHGMLFWTATADEEDLDFFPDAKGVGVDDQDAAIFLIPDSHLRSPAEPAPLVSGDVVGTAPTRESGWEFDVNPADGTSDTFVLENPDPDALTTVMDVDGNVFHVNALGDVAEGDSFQIIVADSITGTPVIATEGWNFDPATGSVVFGAVGPVCNPDTQGDLDGDGMVAFADFLILSNNFGTEVAGHEQGDIDCSGDVAFADFLVLSNNFGQAVGAETSAVPEPSGLGILAMGLLAVAGLRRRR